MYNRNNNNYINNYGNGGGGNGANSNTTLPSSFTSSSSMAFANRSAAIITSDKVKQKMTLSAVTGKVVVYSAQDGSTRIGQ